MSFAKLVVSGTADCPGPPVSSTSVPLRGPVAGSLAYARSSVPGVRPEWSSGTVTRPHCAPAGQSAAEAAGGAAANAIAASNTARLVIIDSWGRMGGATMRYPDQAHCAHVRVG